MATNHSAMSSQKHTSPILDPMIFAMSFTKEDLMGPLWRTHLPQRLKGKGAHICFECLFGHHSNCAKPEECTCVCRESQVENLVLSKQRGGPVQR